MSGRDGGAGEAGGAGGSPLPGPERRVLEAVDREELLTLLGELVAVESRGGEPGEREAQELMAARMAERGLAVDRWEIDFGALREHPAYSADLEREAGLGVVGVLGGGPAPAAAGASAGGAGGAGRTLVLNGHVDVVPAGEEERWTVPPFRATRREGEVLGRGTADMKGALAAAVSAAAAIRRADVELAGRLELHSVLGEEDGGAGTLASLERGHGRGADGAVVMEPTRLAVAPAQAGALNFRITVPGEAAHGALREEGVDPVEKFVPILRAVRELEAERNGRLRDPLFDGTLPFAVCIGRVRAGEWASTVAESLEAEGRLGVAPGEDPGAAREELEAAVARAARNDPWLREHPPEVAWWGAQFEPARTDPGAPVVRAARRAHRDAAGAEAEVRGMPYGADMRLLTGVGGVPTLLYGPGDVRRAHRPDEGVEADELLTAARAYALLALRFCGTAGDPGASSTGDRTGSAR